MIPRVLSNGSDLGHDFSLAYIEKKRILRGGEIGEFDKFRGRKLKPDCRVRFTMPVAVVCAPVRGVGVLFSLSPPDDRAFEYVLLSRTPEVYDAR